MSRPQRWWRGMAVLAAAALLTSAPGPSLQAAPNPYGPGGSKATTIVLHPDGSYDVTLQQSQELVREYSLSFGGGVHDGFRLPEDGGVLPPYLRATYTLTSFTVPPGQPTPAGFTRTNHRLSAQSTGTYPTGTHAAELRYRVSGAASPTERGWTTHIRLLDVGYGEGNRVEIRAEELRARRLSLRCVTYPPDSEPCGILSGTTLVHVQEDDPDHAEPPEFLVEIEADNTAVPPPTIDRR